MGKRELVALLKMSSYCLVIFVWLFLTVPWFCLKFVIALFPDYTHLLFLLYLLGGLCLALRVKRLYCVISSLAILSLR